MELRDFVKTTLVQIAEAINDAHTELADANAEVNPANLQGYTGSEMQHVYGWIDHNARQGHSRQVTLINFDVAAFAGEDTGTRGGIGIVIGTIALGSQGRTDQSRGSESRIKFSIPMMLPSFRVEVAAAR